jgi:hypothetical protein
MAMENMKKQIFLAVGVIALILAAKEYGINSLQDLKRVLNPYLKMVDLKELMHEEEEEAETAEA